MKKDVLLFILYDFLVFSALKEYLQKPYHSNDLEVAKTMKQALSNIKRNLRNIIFGSFSNYLPEGLIWIFITAMEHLHLDPDLSRWIN